MKKISSKKKTFMENYVPRFINSTENGRISRTLALKVKKEFLVQNSFKNIFLESINKYFSGNFSKVFQIREF